MTRRLTNLAALKQTRRSRKSDEHRLQCAIVQVCALAGVDDLIVYHPANGMVSNPITVSRMKAAGLLPGVADLSIILPGAVAVQMEVKIPGGVQSPEQVAFEQNCKRNGTRYIKVHTLDQAIDALTDIGALRLDKVRGLRREPTRSAAA